MQSKQTGLVERVEAQRKLTERFKSVMKLFSPNSFDNQQQVKKKVVVVNRKRSMPKATTSAANKFPNEVAEKRDKADVNANQKTQTGAEQKSFNSSKNWKIKLFTNPIKAFEVDTNKVGQHKGDPVIQ